MAVGFRRRSAVLIAPKVASYLSRTLHKELSHSCSASLPGRSDPAVASLHDSANTLLGWTMAPQAGIAWIREGVDHLNQLLAGLTDLLHRSQVQDRLCKTPASSWTERLLQDLVLLADAHGCFCDMLLSLKQLLAEAQAAVRHGNAVLLTGVLRVRRRSDRGLSGLASTLRGLSHRSSSSTTATSALAEAAAAATCAAAAASITIFVALASASASSALRAMTSPTVASPTEAMERLRSLEERVVAAEDGSEQVHRALLDTRGALLNVLTPCF